MSAIFDLLGDPIPEGWSKRGRPPHFVDDEKRNRVMILLAFGWSDSRIAKALGVSKGTFRKHYLNERRYRDEARDRVEAGLATTLWNLARDGNVAAAKEFRKVMERNDMMNYGQLPVEAKPAKAPKLGKKEEALLAASQPDEGTPLGELIARRQTVN